MTIDEAKLQVSIRQRIWDARRRYFQRYDAWPTVLYLGHDDFRDLIRECELGEMCLAHDRTKTYMGLTVLRVEEERWLDVGVPDGR